MEKETICRVKFQMRVKLLGWVSLCLAVFMIGFSSIVYADTNIPGGNLGNQTWTAAGSPYILFGDITVPIGVTLTIQPGTIVLAKANQDPGGSGEDPSRISITVQGTLIAVGTSSDPILFSSTAPNVRTWDRIILDTGSQGAIQNCIIENANVGIDVRNSYADIINNTIVDNYLSGILLKGSSNPIIKNNIIVGNYYGIRVEATTATPVISYNDVFGNTQNYWNSSTGSSFTPSPGTGSICLDPLFVDGQGGDYRLQWTSPCINAGDPDPSYNDPDGTRNDIGAHYYFISSGINYLPVAFNQTAKTNEDSPVSIILTAFDANGDPLTFTVVSSPSHGTLTGTVPNLTYSPNANYNGPDSFTFKANDGTSDSNIATVSIMVNPVNHPPSLTPIGNKTTNEGELLEFTITATDPDGDVLTYSASNLPTGATFDPVTQKFSRTTGYDQAGNYPNVLFTVTDNGSPPLSASEAITITVGNVNRPPVLDPIGNKTVEEGQLLTIIVTADDPDGDTLIYSASNLPTGATFDQVTHIFTWTPTYEQAGTYVNLLFTVTDNGIPSASASETITITVGNVNRPPILNPIGNKTVNEGELLEITITATDPDGDVLTYSVSNLPSGGNFDPVN